MSCRRPAYTAAAGSGSQPAGVQTIRRPQPAPRRVERHPRRHHGAGDLARGGAGPGPLQRGSPASHQPGGYHTAQCEPEEHRSRNIPGPRKFNKDRGAEEPLVSPGQWELQRTESTLHFKTPGQ